MVAGTVGMFLSGCQDVLWWRHKPEAVTVVDRPPSPRAGAIPPEARAASFRPDLIGKVEIQPGLQAQPQAQPEPQLQAQPGALAPVKKFTYPVGLAVPGREGFVLSPFNQKMVDVAGFKSGALVADPHYPLSDKKFFRVP